MPDGVQELPPVTTLHAPDKRTMQHTRHPRGFAVADIIADHKSQGRGPAPARTLEESKLHTQQSTSCKYIINRSEIFYEFAFTSPAELSVLLSARVKDDCIFHIANNNYCYLRSSKLYNYTIYNYTYSKEGQGCNEILQPELRAGGAEFRHAS